MTRGDSKNGGPQRGRKLFICHALVRLWRRFGPLRPVTTRKTVASSEGGKSLFFMPPCGSGEGLGRCDPWRLEKLWPPSEGGSCLFFMPPCGSGDDLGRCDPWRVEKLWPRATGVPLAPVLPVLHTFDPKIPKLWQAPVPAPVPGLCMGLGFKVRPQGHGSWV